MPGTIPQYQVVIPGQVLTAALWNGMELNIINNGLVWSGIDDYSATDSEMQITTAPFPGGVISRPTSAQGELERVRFQFKNITGESQWYNDPDITLAAAATFNTTHTHTGTTDGTQIPTAGIADGAVTSAKLAAAVAGDGLAGGAGTALSVNVDASTIEINADTLRVKDAGITSAKLAAAVAGDGLAGGAGTALSVNVDNSTIEINSDSLRVKDAGITPAKLSAAVPAAVGMKSIQTFTVAVNITNGTASATTNTVITSINTAKSVAILTSLTQSGGSAQAARYTVALTTSTNLATTVIIPVNSSGTSTFSASVTVLEFN